MCMLIKDLAVGALLAAPSSGDIFGRRGALSSLLKSSFFWVAAPNPDTSGVRDGVESFSRFFRPQKVHYNALFAKFRPAHAL